MRQRVSSLFGDSQPEDRYYEPQQITDDTLMDVGALGHAYVTHRHVFVSSRMNITTHWPNYNLFFNWLTTSSRWPVLVRVYWPNPWVSTRILSLHDRKWIDWVMLIISTNVLNNWPSTSRRCISSAPPCVSLGKLRRRRFSRHSFSLSF